jgi:hypothetical protein
VGKIIELPLTFDPEALLARKGLGFEPDFQVFTSGIEADRQNPRLVHMIGSSTEKDLQGDTMSLLALSDMTKAPQNMTIWLNHDYNLPDSIFGSVVGAPSIFHKDGVADLQLAVDVELDNPHAARVKRYIDNGRKLGCSIGCMVTKYEVPDESDGERWYEQSIIIHGVYVVEYSVVGIPCNQRSWVENAVRGVFTRTLHPSLAPAMKSLWPSAYKTALKSLPQDAREEYEQLPSRRLPDSRIEWLADKKTFSLSRGSVVKELSADEVREFISEGDTEEMRKTIKTTHAVPSVAVDDPLETLTEKSAVTLPETPGEEVVDSPEITPEDVAPAIVPEDVAPAVVPEDVAPAVVPEDVASEAASEDPAPTPEVTEIPDAPTELPAHTLALLSGYNFMAKSLQLPEVAPEHLAEAQQAALLQRSVSSGADMQRLQAIHDMVCAMSGGQVCGDMVDDDESDDVSGNGPLSVSYDLAHNVSLLNKAIDQYHTATVDLFDIKKDAAQAKADLQSAREQIGTLAMEVEKAQQTIATLKDMPLGNPVGHSRTVHAEDAVATREDMMQVTKSARKSEAVATDSLPAAIALTQIKEVPMTDGRFMRYRYWPDGVGGTVKSGVRPELTLDQVSMMQFSSIVGYRDGREAMVPHFGSQ